MYFFNNSHGLRAKSIDLLYVDIFFPVVKKKKKKNHARAITRTTTKKTVKFIYTCILCMYDFPVREHNGGGNGQVFLVGPSRGNLCVVAQN